MTTSEAAGPQPSAAPRWSARHPAQAAACYALVFLAVSLGAEALGLVRLPVLVVAALAFLVWVLTLGSSLLLALSICRLRLRPGVEVAWLVGMLALFVLARPEVLYLACRALGRPGLGRGLMEVLLVAPEQRLVGNLALILLALLLGRLVSRVVREGKLLLPVAFVASLADFLTVYWGVVAHMEQTAPEVVEAFSAHAPLPAPGAVPVPMLASVGLGDYLFLALFLGVTVRYAMRPVAAMWASFAVMLVVPLGFLLWPGLPGMPGLPFLSAAVLGANWRYLRFTRQEKRALAFSGLLVVAVAAGIIMLSR